jgi:hypothetical protein
MFAIHIQNIEKHMAQNPRDLYLTTYALEYTWTEAPPK